MKVSERREAGRVLDAEVCRALGWTSVIGDEEVFWRTEHGDTVGRIDPPNFSGEIALAFQVVEAMRAKSFGFYLDIDAGPGDGTPCAMFTTSLVIESRRGDTPAHAICLAALAALESATPAEAAVPTPDTASPLSSPRNLTQ